MAIVYDTFTDGGFVGPVTSHTYTHTCSASSNRILFVFVSIASASDLVSGVTYGGVSMTRIDTQIYTAGRSDYLYYLVNPATGANNVVISTSSSTDIGALSTSYTGVAQTSPIDVSAKNTGTSVATKTTSLTTLTDNCWTILQHHNTASNPTAGASTTKRGYNAADVGMAIFDSNAAITPAGTTSLISNFSTGNVGQIMAAFKPFVTVTDTSKFFNLF